MFRQKTKINRPNLEALNNCFLRYTEYSLSPTEQMALAPGLVMLHFYYYSIDLSLSLSPEKQ